MNKYPQVENIYQPSPPQTNRQHLHTVQAGAWLPFMQATITGVILGLGTLTLAIILDARHPETWSLVIGVLTWVVTWLLLQRHWFTLTALEKLTGLDLDRDGLIAGQAVKNKPAEVRVRLSQGNESGYFQENIFTLPATLEQLKELARGLILNRLPFSERTWAGSGRPFSIAEFRDLRSEMIKRGLLTLVSAKDPRQGSTLTAAGRQVMRGLLSSFPSPIPQ